MNSSDTPRFTSSPESADGLLPSSSPDGIQAGLFGQVPAPANRSVPRGGGKATRTTGTSGRRCSGSSASAGLARSLANKLQAATGLDGGTVWLPTLSLTATPQGRLCWTLAALDVRSEGVGSSGLPTLAAREGRDWSKGAILARLDIGDGVAKRICSLSEAARSSPGTVGLNPSFGQWMMGYPDAWTSCGVLAMQSCRRLPRRSSKCS